MLLILLCFSCPVWAAPVAKTFEWSQAAVETARTDFGGWNLYYAIAAGGPYTKLTTINFVSQQTTYTKEVTLSKPEWDGKILTLYFVATAFNKLTGQETAYSNEASGSCDFSNVFTAPFNLKITITP